MRQRILIAYQVVLLVGFVIFSVVVLADSQKPDPAHRGPLSSLDTRSH